MSLNAVIGDAPWDYSQTFGLGQRIDSLLGVS